MNTNEDFQKIESPYDNTIECDSVETPERLTEDDIKKLPRFGNYDRGTPNEVNFFFYPLGLESFYEFSFSRKQNFLTS